ncbi:MAG: hypothetical protein WC324_02090 [Candidatus Omnitrophota bacterium]|jgi:hypothetical protein
MRKHWRKDVIVGAKYWNDRSRYYVQTNNPTEEMLRKEDGKGFLESCGGSSSANCIASLGFDVEIKCPGGFVLQADEVAVDFFNDPRNYEKLRRLRPGIDPSAIQGNRIPQYYPLMAKEVFGVKAEYFESLTWNKLEQWLALGSAVQICLKEPGHFLAVVAKDLVTDEIVFHDSWPARVGGDGFSKRMGKSEFDTNVKNFCIVYWK